DARCPRFSLLSGFTFQQPSPQSPSTPRASPILEYQSLHQQALLIDALFAHSPPLRVSASPGYPHDLQSRLEHRREIAPCAFPHTDTAMLSHATLVAILVTCPLFLVFLTTLVTYALYSAHHRRRALPELNLPLKSLISAPTSNPGLGTAPVQIQHDSWNTHLAGLPEDDDLDADRGVPDHVENVEGYVMPNAKRWDGKGKGRDEELYMMSGGNGGM
ncbi:hypothetical protein BCR34DRAFT_640106, partial [Clohesyomyces aquaticus]